MRDRNARAVATVVVPTYRRPASLARCVAALRGQSIGSELELIVVHDGPLADNGCSTGVDVVETEARRGPAASRNAGARLASSPYVLFTDDDCVPAFDWAQRLLATLASGSEVAAGQTTSHGGAPARASQAIADELMAYGATAESLAFAPTLNLACTKRVLEEVPFDETFATAAGEDRAWCLELRARGITIARAPDAWVDHRPDLSLQAFVRQHVRYGRGSSQYRRRYRQPPPSRSFYVGLVRRGFRAGPAVGGLVLLAQAATAAGIASGRVAPTARLRDD